MMHFLKIGLVSLFSALIIGPFIFVVTISALENVFNLSDTENKTRKVRIPEPIGVSVLANEEAKNLQVSSAVVIQILDFNTIKVLLNDGMQDINLIGISENENCDEETVIAAIQNIALGKKVYLVDDKNYKNNSFVYKYVFTDQLLFLNQELIKQGIVSADNDSNYIYKENFMKSEATSSECAIQLPNENKLEKTIQQEKTTDNLYSRLLATATPIPTNTPTPTPTPSPTASPSIVGISQTTNSKPSSLNPELLFVLINNHRASIGKPPFEKHPDLCSLAVSRGPELYDEIFVNYNVHAGLNNRNLPYWITENMAHYDTEEQVFNWWMGSALHRSAIEGDFKYSCGECYGNSCAQLFTSWTPK